jgi:hypothetical protein
MYGNQAIGEEQAEYATTDAISATIMSDGLNTVIGDTQLVGDITRRVHRLIF